MLSGGVRVQPGRRCEARGASARDGTCPGSPCARGAQEGEECPVVIQSRAPPASGSSLAGCMAWGPALQRVVTCSPPEPLPLPSPA